jgi:magnesium and cobalt exporter, CNNM family
MILLPAALYIIALISLIGTFALSAFSTAFRRIHPEGAQKQFDALGNLFFYRPFHLFFFPKQDNEGIYFVTICALSLTRFCYCVSAILILLHSQLYDTWFGLAVGIIFLFLIYFILGDFIPRIFATKNVSGTIKFFAPLASLFLLLIFPLAYPFLKLSSSLSRKSYFEHFLERPESEVEQEVMRLVREANLTDLEPHEKKLIVSVLSFRNRIVREIMVPRVNVFSLSADTKIKDATEILEEEGYSRVPVFKDTVDNIVGVLMLKDLVAKYAEYTEKGNLAEILEAPISTIQKPPLYTPETKKISDLLQEFRRKKVHIAIVVDEYGGTEGIVTIEDILEEIVGEIADEYDTEEEQFIALPDGSWMVDAMMSINDAEQQLSIKIPQEGDYDTIGGYIFHCTGSIPSRGFVIHHDDFELEIIRSNDRCVEKVRIYPILNKQKDRNS